MVILLEHGAMAIESPFVAKEGKSIGSMFHNDTQEDNAAATIRGRDRWLPFEGVRERVDSQRLLSYWKA
jgi:hypothetical protein